MAYFTPPTATAVPPISVADSEHAPATSAVNPLGWKLMRHYLSGLRGCNVFLMSDGTYRIDPKPDVDIPGVLVEQPYPATTPDLVPNGVLSNAYYDTELTVTPLREPTVVKIYQGGAVNEITAEEVTTLTAAGFGAYIVD